MIAAFPALTYLAIVVSALLSVYAFNLFALALMVAKKIFAQEGEDIDPPTPENLPTVTIQIPIYNEGPLVERVLENIASLDYPKERLQIQILDDSTDEETLREEEWLAEHYRGEGYEIELIHRENRIGYKAGALNNGLRTAKGDYVVIVDADTISPRNFVKELISQFSGDERLAFVQTRCEYSDRWFNWVTESNAIARDIHFLVEQSAKNWYNLLPNFSGKAGMWRREVLEKYGWDEGVLTEDIELSYRVQLDGWRSLYLHNPTCLIELPPSLTALKTQQKRWTAGFAQAFKKLWRPLLRSDRLTFRQKFEALIFLSSPVTHLAALTAIALWALAAIFEPEATLSLWLGTFAFSAFMAFMSGSPHLSVIMGILRSRDRRGRKLLTIPLTITIVTANLIANARGAIEGFLGKDLIFEKTHKYGITHNTRKYEIKTDYRWRHLMRKNGAELVAATLGFITTIRVLLQGQITSAIPLSYISLAWLIGSIQR
jgi:cellulose synthase/poly-beta-1,6-N-acetylglucosamine synthase-like glycosyltransferase